MYHQLLNECLFTHLTVDIRHKNVIYCGMDYPVTCVTYGARVVDVRWNVNGTFVNSNPPQSVTSESGCSYRSAAIERNIALLWFENISAGCNGTTVWCEVTYTSMYINGRNTATSNHIQLQIQGHYLLLDGVLSCVHGASNRPSDRSHCVTILSSMHAITSIISKCRGEGGGSGLRRTPPPPPPQDKERSTTRRSTRMYKKVH